MIQAKTAIKVPADIIERELTKHELTKVEETERCRVCPESSGGWCAKYKAFCTNARMKCNRVEKIKGGSKR